MSAKRTVRGKNPGVRASVRRSAPANGRVHREPAEVREKTRGVMAARVTASGNEYRCAMEINQNGKYNVRVRAAFGRNGWVLPIYFLASSFDAGMKRLEEALQLLQRNEEHLWFWSRERSDDPNLAADLLAEMGLGLDRRLQFPRKTAGFGVPRERPVSAGILAPVRRVLAESVTEARPVMGD